MEKTRIYVYLFLSKAKGMVIKMKAFIIDFNGTLFMDTAFHTKAWQEIYKELHPGEGDGPDGNFYCGPRNDVLIERIAPWLTPQKRQEVSKHKEEIYRKICEENPEQVRLVKGTEEFLKKLQEKKIPFILASASIKENIDFYFKTFALDRWFDKKETVYDDGTYAHKGAMHIEAAKRLGVEISECIVIEDSVSAITHAKEVGAGCVIGIGKEENRDKIVSLGVDCFICDFSELNFRYFLNKNEKSFKL